MPQPLFFMDTAAVTRPAKPKTKVTPITSGMIPATVSAVVSFVVPVLNAVLTSATDENKEPLMAPMMDTTTMSATAAPMMALARPVSCAMWGTTLLIYFKGFSVFNGDTSL